MDNKLYNLPEEIRLLPQWMCWCGEKKYPISPVTEQRGRVNDPKVWGTFDEAVKACEKNRYDGVGFVFRKDGGYFGVDLDKCLKNKAFCDEFVETLQSYNEYSRSGTGLHILCKGTLPDGSRRKGGIEMYSEGRWFICTGNIYNPKYKEIVDCTETIKPLRRKYMPTETKNLIKPHTKTHIDDVDIIRYICMSKYSVIFNLLYQGEWSGLHQSQSEADFELCCLLARYTSNAEQIDRLFRKSKLMREKWDEKHGAMTYGEMTTENAIIKIMGAE